ncbi:hypothetical protein OP10G_4390 [Fimbriimonas ginsengisoli Gsoil 348]|uniref:Uncharacterized protein n=1 Tax=Fimbriimonas ginsengisoli Gsoil 348 TaxID=661478 RepID=A0A068NW48_FIMGI|nr:hypothetical protein OP10G_4390 [Fimbriimonas ginsengisoli Gsoil 348]
MAAIGDTRIVLLREKWAIPAHLEADNYDPGPSFLKARL